MKRNLLYEFENSDYEDYSDQQDIDQQNNNILQDPEKDKIVLSLEKTPSFYNYNNIFQDPKKDKIVLSLEKTPSFYNFMAKIYEFQNLKFHNSEGYFTQEDADRLITLSYNNKRFPDSLKIYSASKLKYFRNIETIQEGFFSWMSGLGSIIFPDKIKEIPDKTCLYCTQLKRVILPKNLEEIGIDAFRGTSLKQIILPDSVEFIYDNAFYGCPLKSVYLPKNIKYYGRDNFVGEIKILNDDKTIVFGSEQEEIDHLFQYSLAEKILIKEGTEKIYGGAFLGSFNLEEIVFPNSFTKIGGKNLYGAGWKVITPYCPSLKKVTIPRRFEKDIREILGCKGFGKDWAIDPDFNKYTVTPDLSQIEVTYI